MANNNGSGGGLDQLSAQAYEIARRRQAAAVEVVAMLEDQLETWFEASAATVLHAGAWLAGTSLYHSIESAADGGPGSAPFDARSNEEGLKLMKVFMFLVDKDGIQLKPADFAAEVHPDWQAHKSLGQVREHFQERYNEIMSTHEFDYLEGAKTGAVACAKLVKLHCLNRADLQPPVAASIVSLGFVEGAKTPPSPAAGGGNGDEQ